MNKEPQLHLGVPALFLELWREQHSKGHEQTPLISKLDSLRLRAFHLSSEREVGS